MAGYLYLKTFGCQMNEYDSARMADVLHEALGLAVTADPLEADVVLVNTCSVRDKAEGKVYSQLGSLRPLKERNPAVILGVGGCVASQEGEGLLARAPYVDLVFGPQTLHRLPAMIEAVRTTGRAQVDVSFPEIEKFDRLPAPRASAASAFVSIMEGCSKYCSFCVVPYTRGEEVSRPLADVLAEVRHLAGNGVKELTLLGQNVNAYVGAMPDGAAADFALLLAQVAKLEGIESDTRPEQIGAKVEFVDFSCAISESYRFELGVFESLESHRLGHFRIKTLAAKLPVSVFHRAAVDDFVARCDLATTGATDLLALCELGWIHIP